MMLKSRFISNLLFILVISCSPTHSFKKDKTLFESSRAILTFVSVSDLNDSYFVIKENDFFEFYRMLFDSVKNSSYPGKFTRQGDTMLLRFYNKKGTAFLGKKALVSANKNEIVFFDRYPGIKNKLVLP